jgi:hypothetical protein
VSICCNYFFSIFRGKIQKTVGMAPKRSAKVAAKTTRKVVREETVLVAVVAATDQTPAAVLGDDEDKENEGNSQR